ncbi:signal recognition particle-docking protein FtsY [Candidatus Altiarchaeota archaeon]
MFSSLKDKLQSFISKTTERAEEKEEIPAEREEAQPEESTFIPSREAVQKEEEKPKEELKVKLTTTTSIKGVLSGKVSLKEEDLEGALHDLLLDLIQSDIEMGTSEAILSRLKDKIVGRDIPKEKLQEEISKSLREVLKETISPEEKFDFLSFIKEKEKPVVVLFLGINGTGKTTTIAKITHLLREKGLSAVLAAGDTFRAGAIEQIEKLGSDMNVKVISHQKGADSAAVIYDAVEHAKARKIDVVLADSAGRMQTNVNLMDEIRKVVRVNQPDIKVFIGDSLTGNDAVEQARSFHEAVGIDAVILTKMDADSKGGSAISICHEIKKPIIYVGIGQKLEDLREFDVDWFVEQII